MSFFLIGLLVLAAAAGGFYFWAQRQSPPTGYGRDRGQPTPTGTAARATCLRQHPRRRAVTQRSRPPASRPPHTTRAGRGPGEDRHTAPSRLRAILNESPNRPASPASRSRRPARARRLGRGPGGIGILLRRRSSRPSGMGVRPRPGGPDHPACAGRARRRQRPAYPADRRDRATAGRDAPPRPHPDPARLQPPDAAAAAEPRLPGSSPGSSTASPPPAPRTPHRGERQPRRRGRRSLPWLWSRT